MKWLEATAPRSEVTDEEWNAFLIESSREYRAWLRDKIAAERENPKPTIPRRWAKYYCNTKEIRRGRYDRPPRDWKGKK